MNKKYLAVVACIALTLSMFVALASPVNARIPALMNVLQYRWFTTQDAVFTALLSPDSLGGVDTMQWPLTSDQYNSIKNNNQIVVEPLSEAGEFEMAFNNNFTDGVNMDRRSPMNYTDFRNAMNCLVDVDGTITGPILGGFATHSYTQVPYPLMSDYVPTNVIGANYPWNYNVTHALEILWNGGWYNHATYPTLASLITAYGGGTGSLSTAGGTASGVVYSGNDPNGQWGGDTTPNATANGPRANTPLAPLKGYVRSGDARKGLGDSFTNALQSIGCPFDRTYAATLGALRPFVIDAQFYDFATLGYSMGAPPSWLFTELTPIGIPSTNNPYLVQDPNTTNYATLMWNAPDIVSFTNYAKIVQYNLVMESYLVGGYSPATYCAYKTGILGQIDILGQGTQANGGQTENWIMLDTRKNTTITYTGDKASTPESNVFYIGVYNPPSQINPIFQDSVFAFQVSDEIFTYCIGGNPYTLLPGSAITGAPTGNDLPWMAYSWKTTAVASPELANGDTSTWTNVTLFLRHDVLWHDNVSLTTDDINFTIWASAFYGNAFDHSSMIFAVNQTAGALMAPYFQKDITPSDPTGSYTCSIYVNSTSFLALYYPLYQVIPWHLYKNIATTDNAAAMAGTATDGLTGLWPGRNCVAGGFTSNPYFTLAQLNNNPETTLVGTGPFTYRVGSITVPEFESVGGITLDANPQFFMPIAPGAVALKYTWISTSPASQPSGGYFKIGLPDLVYLANSYGKTGTPGSTVSLANAPGTPHTWNPGCDLAAPSGVVGLSDLVTLATHYGWYFGNYSYNAPYPPAEVAHGGP